MAHSNLEVFVEFEADEDLDTQNVHARHKLKTRGLILQKLEVKIHDSQVIHISSLFAKAHGTVSSGLFSFT